MKIQVLLSCMHQVDHTIVKRTNIQTDAVVINQCDRNEITTYQFSNKLNQICNVIFVSTIERGLSKSRNMALKYATGDICIICDDDEILCDNYEEIISNVFQNNKIDFATLVINKKNRIYPNKKFCINKIRALTMSSYQICFRLKSIIDKGIRFNERFGSGVSKAGGEENLFLFSCLKSGLHGMYYPISFGEMIESESQWWKGFTKEYFYDHAILSKALWGRVIGLCYIVYTLFDKYPMYKNDISFYKAFKAYLKGYLS